MPLPTTRPQVKQPHQCQPLPPAAKKHLVRGGQGLPSHIRHTSCTRTHPHTRMNKQHKATACCTTPQTPPQELPMPMQPSSAISAAVIRPLPRPTQPSPAALAPCVSPSLSCRLRSAPASASSLMHFTLPMAATKCSALQQQVQPPGRHATGHALAVYNTHVLLRCCLVSNAACLGPEQHTRCNWHRHTRCCHVSTRSTGCTCSHHNCTQLHAATPSTPRLHTRAAGRQ